MLCNIAFHVTFPHENYVKAQRFRITWLWYFLMLITFKAILRSFYNKSPVWTLHPYALGYFCCGRPSRPSTILHPQKKNKKTCMLCMQELLFLGGWINWNMVIDVYIFTKGKSNNPAKNENVELTHTQVFCGWLCAVRIIVTKDELCWCHGHRSVQNADQTGYKILPEVLICNLATYRVLLNRFCAIIFHDYLHYYGSFLARFLICIFFNKATTVFWSLTKRPQSFLLEFQAFMESFSIRALDVSND